MPINAVISASRATGLAPLAVYFDASTSTSTNVTRPFHQLYYKWNFGDSKGETWANGARSGLDKNIAYGPVAAHVFESAVNATVTLTIFDGVETKETTVSVTAIDDEASADAGGYAQLHFFSNDTTYAAGTPADGALGGRVTRHDNIVSIDAALSTFLTVNAAFYFEYGDNFTQTGPVNITTKDGPGVIGANPYGSGAKPLISAAAGKFIIGQNNGTNNDLADWRLVDLDMNSVSDTEGGILFNGPATQILMLGIEIRRAKIGIEFVKSSLDTLNSAVAGTVPIWPEIYLVDSSVGNCFDYCWLGEANKLAVLGCRIEDIAIPPEIAAGLAGHVFRLSYSNNAVISNNSFAGPSDRTVVTIRGVDFAGDNTIPANSYTEKIVFSDNKVEAGAGDTANALMFTVRRVNDTQTDVRLRNIIVERNWLVTNSRVAEMLATDAGELTIRNNLWDFTGGGGESLISMDKHSSTPAGVNSNVNIVNNTVFSSSTVTRNFDLVTLATGTNSASPANFILQNNIGYVPNWTGTHEALNSTGASAGSGSTVANNQVGTTDPTFVEPTGARDQPNEFLLSAGSAMIGAGADGLKVWEDFFNAIRDWETPNTDIGFDAFTTGSLPSANVTPKGSLVGLG